MWCCIIVTTVLTTKFDVMLSLLGLVQLGSIFKRLWLLISRFEARFV